MTIQRLEELCIAGIVAAIICVIVSLIILGPLLEIAWTNWRFETDIEYTFKNWVVALFN